MRCESAPGPIVLKEERMQSRIWSVCRIRGGKGGGLKRN